MGCVFVLEEILEMPKKMDTSILVKKIITEIQSGELVDQDLKLPAEPNLMSRYEVTRYTLRQALKQLSVMGYTYQVHGVGTFVRHQQTVDSVALEHEGGLSAEMERIGRKLTTKAASEKIIPVSEALFLPKTHHFQNDDKLIEVRRFRLLDDKPYLMEQSYYLQSVIDSIPEEALYGSLFKYFEQSRKTQIGFIDQTIMSEPLPEEASDFMEMPAGSPSLLIQDESYLANGELLAFSKQYYNYQQAKLFMIKKVH